MHLVEESPTMVPEMSLQNHQWGSIRCKLYVGWKYLSWMKNVLIAWYQQWYKVKFQLVPKVFLSSGMRWLEKNWEPADLKNCSVSAHSEIKMFAVLPWEILVSDNSSLGQRNKIKCRQSLNSVTFGAGLRPAVFAALLLDYTGPWDSQHLRGGILSS